MHTVCCLHEMFTRFLLRAGAPGVIVPYHCLESYVFTFFPYLKGGFYSDLISSHKHVGTKRHLFLLLL